MFDVLNGEVCDDGYIDVCGICNADCTVVGVGVICGDSVVCSEFEICDDGYVDACGICNADCIAVGVGVICGDSSVCSEFEICDDGNTEIDFCVYGEIECMVCDEYC